MRKIVVVLLSLVMLISISACDKAAENMRISEPIKLTNKMTETELSRVEKHTLTLFDDPTEKEHKVSVVYSTVSLDELFAQLENNRDMISDEEYQIAFQEIEKMMQPATKIMDSLRKATQDATPDEMELTMQFDISLKGETPVLKIVSAETSAQLAVKFTWKNEKS